MVKRKVDKLGVACGTEDKLGVACGTNVDDEMQSVGIGKPVGKRELRRLRPRWKRQIPALFLRGLIYP
jgi:hypothetical protein